MAASDLRDVQGNVLTPFPRDHQVFLFLTFAAASRPAAWLAAIAPSVTLSGQGPGLDAGCGVGLSASGLALICPAAAAEAIARSAVFGAGAAARAACLRDSERDGPAGWLFGSPAAPRIDAVVLLAAKTPASIKEQVDAHLAIAARHGVALAFRQDCGDLPGAMSGREHFGFRDGISQPLTCDASEAETEADRRVPIGEFVLGQARVGETEMPPPVRSVPEWMRNGSFQVVRRLNQDVAGWRRQLDRLTAEYGGRLGLSAEHIAAKLIGRWPSGAPLAAAPDRDTAAMADAAFDFDDDPEGFVTPRFAHIRKMLPRMSGFPERQWRRIIRRGVPFGPPWDPAQPGSDERGLLLNAYMADIEEQFEFLIRAWANDPDFPEGGDGLDPLIGRGNGAAVLRRRNAPACPLRLEQHVTVTGCIYSFVPSGSGLQWLARLASAPPRHATSEPREAA